MENLKVLRRGRTAFNPCGKRREKSSSSLAGFLQLALNQLDRTSLIPNKTTPRKCVQRKTRDNLPHARAAVT